MVRKPGRPVTVTENWQPAEMQKHLDTQVAFNADRVHFRFRWDQPDPGGWIHDMLVYHEGKWQQFADPSPWVTGDDGPAHTGFYEDRVSFLLDDGSVKGFEEFGGWLTAHEGMRSLPSAASADEVQGPRPLWGRQARQDRHSEVHPAGLRGRVVGERLAAGHVAGRT